MKKMIYIFTIAFLAGMVVYGGSYLGKEEKKKETLLSALPYQPGQLVVKGLSPAFWNQDHGIPSLKLAYTFGPHNEYALLTFDPALSPYEVGRKINGYALWSEPNYKRFLYQNKSKKSKKKKKKKGRKKKDKKKSRQVRPIRPPRDALFRMQWAAHNFGQDAPGGIVGKIGADIDLLRAWAISRGSKKVLVAVLDTGIDYNHPDLEKNIWVNEKEKYGIPNYDDDGNGFVDDVHGWNFVAAEKWGNEAGSPDPMDDNGHGTHCAGIIGARANNLKGVAGVNWEVSIMALKFLNATGSGDAVGIYRGIMYAIKNKARIISCSFGAGQKSRLEEDAMKAAQKAGVLIVAAAGNDGVSNDRKESYPANYPLDNIISVAATNNIDKLAEFSNFGAENVDIAAPGVDILSTFPKGNYGTASGTSMATPMVSGVAALLLSVKPDLNPPAIIKRLMETSDPIVDLVGRVKSWGRVNAYNCLAGIKPPRKYFDLTKVVEEKEKIESIHYPTQTIDYVYKIVKPKAKYVRVHFKIVLTDMNWDYVEILDKDNRKIDSITGYLGDSWSGWVKGNTIKIRLYAAPPMEMKSKRVGNINFLSFQKGKASRTYGFIVDKVAYVK